MDRLEELEAKLIKAREELSKAGTPKKPKHMQSEHGKVKDVTSQYNDKVNQLAHHRAEQETGVSAHDQDALHEYGENSWFGVKDKHQAKLGSMSPSEIDKQHGQMKKKEDEVKTVLDGRLTSSDNLKPTGELIKYNPNGQWSLSKAKKGPTPVPGTPLHVEHGGETEGGNYFHVLHNGKKIGTSSWSNGIGQTDIDHSSHSKHEQAVEKFTGKLPR